MQKLIQFHLLKTKFVDGGMSTDRPYTAVPWRVFVLKVIKYRVPYRYSL